MIKRELTSKQRALVDTLVATGCTITEAARNAGYSEASGRDGGRVTASRTLRLPHVAQYLRQRMQDAFRLEAPRAFATLRYLHADGGSEYVRYHAAATLLDRAGYGQLDQPIEQEAIIVNINLGPRPKPPSGDDTKLISGQVIPIEPILDTGDDEETTGL